MSERQPDYARAARMAAKCLAACGWPAPPVDPLAMLRRCRHVALMTWRQALAELSREELAACGISPDQACGADRLAGWSRTVPGIGTLVIYREDARPEQRRFTLAHELGHIVLNHAAEGRSGPGGKYLSPWCESEANCFAAHLLLPDAAVAAVRAEGADARELARRCGVTLAAARYALAGRG